MAATMLTERHAGQIAGVLSCYDRVLVYGTLPKICYARGMTFHLYEKNIRIFDYPRFAQPFRDELRENAERWARENGLQIDHIRKKNFRKEDKIRQILKQRGKHPGAVWIFSAMESCATYKPWYGFSTKSCAFVVPFLKIEIFLITISHGIYERSISCRL